MCAWVVAHSLVSSQSGKYRKVKSNTKKTNLLALSPLAKVNLFIQTQVIHHTRYNLIR